MKLDEEIYTTRGKMFGDYIVYIYAMFRFDECTNSLREIYEDKDGERKKEVQALSGPNEFGEFYNRSVHK